MRLTVTRPFRRHFTSPSYEMVAAKVTVADFAANVAVAVPARTTYRAIARSEGSGSAVGSVMTYGLKRSTAAICRAPSSVTLLISRCSVS